MSNPLGIGQLDHIGIAVADLEQSVALYRDKWGFAIGERELVEDQGLDMVWCYAGDVPVELIASLHDETPIAKFLQRRGPGLHHVAFAVRDIRAALKTLAHRGVRLIDEEPRPGSQGTLIAFAHPKDGGGVLWELVQHPADGG